MTPRVLVSCFGAIYSLTPAQWVRWLKRRAADKEYADGTLGDRGWGLCLGEAHNVTDMTQEEAKDALASLAATQGRTPSTGPIP